MSDQAKTINLP